MSSPDNLIAFGPDANCTLALCGIENTVYGYRPSLAASSIFIALFGICLLVNVAQLVRWRTWTFSIANVLGCICEMIGYGGRIQLYANPFSFNGFLMQICCITFAPVFFCAAIYVTMSRVVAHLGIQYSRLPAKAYYWIFIPCDLVSLALQAAGGAMSTDSKGSSQMGVNIALAGLSFQVFTLLCFIALGVDYTIRYWRSRHPSKSRLTKPFKTFVGFLSFAILLIFIRCIYRIDELSQGYSGPLIGNQGLFIGLEGVMIVIAAFALNVACPGPAFAANHADGDFLKSGKEVVGAKTSEDELKQSKHSEV